MQLGKHTEGCSDIAWLLWVLMQQQVHDSAFLHELREAAKSLRLALPEQTLVTYMIFWNASVIVSGEAVAVRVLPGLAHSTVDLERMSEQLCGSSR